MAGGELSGAECRLIHSQTDEYGSVSWAGHSSMDADLISIGDDDDGGIKAVDFVPRQLKEEGWVTTAKYEDFGALLERANCWLGGHPQWRIINCESLAVNVSWDAPGEKESTFMLNGREPCVTLLRVWVRRRGQEELSFAQKIGCVHAVPKCLTPDEENSQKMEFATHTATLEELNERLSHDPIPGKIINVETCELRFHRWSASLDVSESYWKRSENDLVNCLHMVRVYYELGKPAEQRLGTKAIVPRRTSSGHQETVTELLRRGRLEQSEALNILSVKMCNYPIARMVTGSYDVVDPEKVFFPEETGPYNNFIHYLRVYYTERDPDQYLHYGGDERELSTIEVYHKTIIPRQLMRPALCCVSDEFEGIHKAMERVSRWSRASGARVLNAETVAVHHIDVSEVVANSEQTYTELCAGAWFHFYIYVYRLYIRGVFHDSLPCVRVTVEGGKNRVISKCSIT